MKSFSLVVQEEIDNALESITNYPFYHQFTVTEWKQKLSQYVFYKIDLSYELNKHKLRWQSMSRIPERSLEMRLWLENYIYEGMEELAKASLPLYFRGEYQFQDYQNNLCLYHNSSLLLPQS